MEKILFVAYQFPPIGGPGVQRSIHFANNLKDFDLQPIVLTIKLEDVKKTSYITDESLLGRLDPSLEIVRVDSGQAFKLIQVLNQLRIYRIFWFLFFPFFWERMALWPWIAYKPAAEQIKKHGIKKIYTSSGPFSTLLLGYFLQKRLKVKWVADMRDPFTDAYAWSFPSKFHWHVSRVFERWILSKPDHLIVNTPEVAKLYKKRRYNPHISVISNGY